MRRLRHEILNEHAPVILRDTIQLGYYPCGECRVCKLHCTNGTMNNIKMEYIYNGRYTNCKTNNIIYYITCTKCGKTYIGETEYCVQQRISQHLAAIRLRYDTSVAQHFTGDHDINTDLSYGILAHNPQWDVITRKEREAYYIRRCNTIMPDGLNVSKGRQIKRTVVPYVGINMNDYCKNSTTITYKNTKNMKRKLVLALKEKINTN